MPTISEIDQQLADLKEQKLALLSGSSTYDFKLVCPEDGNDTFNMVKILSGVEGDPETVVKTVPLCTQCGKIREVGALENAPVA